MYVLSLKISIVSENLIRGHARAQQFQDRVHWIAQSPNTGFAMTNPRIFRYAFKQIGIPEGGHLTLASLRSNA